MDEDDDVAFECNVGLMRQELGKPKLFSYMNHTFTRRQQWILDDCKSKLSMSL